jgi:hypothetical protein
MVRLTSIIGALVLAVPALAQETDARREFIAAAEAAMMPLDLDADGMGGEGAGFLRERARAAELVMMGEQHATADIARFATHLYNDIADAGFGAYVAEIGPWSAAIAEPYLESGLSSFADEARQRAGGLGYPFLFFTEDAELAQAVVTHPSASETALWGVDQVFIAAGPILAPWISARAVTPDQIAAAIAFEDALAENPMLIGAGQPDNFDALERAFADDEDVSALVRAMQLSNEIYAPFTGRGGSGYLANHARETFMREQFLRHVDRARAEGDMPERLFFKFGGNHAMRGRTPTHVMGFGGFIEEWGRINGFSYFSLMAECRGGEARNPQSGETGPCQSYLVGPDTLLGQALPDTAVVIDLVALRRPAIAAQAHLDPQVFDAIFAFDALVILPDVAAAGMIREARP